MKIEHYFELRKPAARGTDNIIADSMRHLNTRQHLGSAIVVCKNPASTLSAARKQWLRLSRSLQKQRSGTLNADKIIKYTHTITRMQRMLFTTRTPSEQPRGEVYFLQPQDISTLPTRCFTIYLLCPMDRYTIPNILEHLAESALIVDYTHADYWPNLGLRSKKSLEKLTDEKWYQAEEFLRQHHINVRKLVSGNLHDREAMDNALDTLLGGHSHEFLRVANEFQRNLELARPLKLKKDVRLYYDALMLLAHRVYTLSNSSYSQHFLETYNEDDTFFLHDVANVHKQLSDPEEAAKIYDHHTRAGRHHLARALQNLTPSE